MNIVRVFGTYMNNSMLILLMLVINTVFSIRIGLVSNTTYIATTIGQTFRNMDCILCTCTALMNSAVAWNCMTINDTCQLIKNYSSTDDGLIATANATFFFQELPPELSSTTNIITMTTTAMTTIPTTTTSMYFKVIAIIFI
jgi:hypothetical protein